MSSQFHRAALAANIIDDKPTALIVAGWPVLLSKANGQAVAVIDRCTHAASALSTGRIRRGSVMCPLHGARFDLATGRCIGGAYAALGTFETRIDDGWIEIAVPEHPPGAEHLPVRKIA